MAHMDKLRKGVRSFSSFYFLSNKLLGPGQTMNQVSEQAEDVKIRLIDNSKQLIPRCFRK